MEAGVLSDRRLGRFRIDLEIINESPEVVRRVMRDVIVIRAETMLMDAVIDYHAQCEAFDPVPQGEEAPAYDILYDVEADTVSWERKES